MLVSDIVLKQLKALYGNKFRVEHEEEPTWAAQLNGYSRETVIAALQQVGIEYPNWPPTVIEFRALCRTECRSDELDHEDHMRLEYTKWAKSHNLEPPRQSETLEHARRRLVWQFECRRRGITSDKLSEIVRANRDANQHLAGAQT